MCHILKQERFDMKRRGNFYLKTDNHSLDGAFNTFTFIGKSLTGLNADIHSIEILKS